MGMCILTLLLSHLFWGIFRLGGDSYFGRNWNCRHYSRLTEEFFQNFNFVPPKANFLHVVVEAALSLQQRNLLHHQRHGIERDGKNRIHLKIKGGAYLQRHRNSFITIEDFKFLYKHGINTVRIPVGWWIAYDPDPPSPFIGGSLEALDNAFSWAQEYDIKCIIDLHAAPASQNGMEHSASRDGFTGWPTSPDYISDSLHAIDFLVSRYAKNPALLGIELLNEPSAATVSLDVLISYYKQGYQIVRKYSSSAYVIICQRIGVADPMELYQANIGSHNLVLDLHFYNLFDTFFDNMSAMDNIQYIYKSRVGQLQALNNSNGPLVLVGKTGIYSYCLFDTALDVSPL
ncbi:hypothetical protein JHK87_032178 [Glycine soja]|nr:hypothetical protein JHK87_032178 [Glycine soja]